MRSEPSNTGASKPARPPIVRSVAAVVVVVSSVLALSTTAGWNIFRCFVGAEPVRPEERCYVTGRDTPRPAGEQTPDGRPIWADRYRLYRDLADLAPGARYTVAVPEGYVNHVSPLMLTVISGAAEVSMIDPAFSDTLTVAVSAPAEERVYQLASSQFTVRFAPGEVRHVVVRRDGRQVFFDDARLLPADLTVPSPPGGVVDAPPGASSPTGRMP